MRHSISRLLAIQEEERRRLARELHDTVGQRTTAIRIRIQMLQAASASQSGPHALDDLLDLVDKIENEVDSVVVGLRPPALDEFGLVAALNVLVDEWSRLRRLSVQLDAMQFTGRVHPRVENCLYRVTQEALNNVFKHARATSAGVVLERRSGDVVLIVHDDGCGFEPRRRAPPGLSRGFGLLGMVERIRLVDGRIAIDAAPGKGTTVFVAVPAPVMSRALAG